MFLLIHFYAKIKKKGEHNLHSNMFLLILDLSKLDRLGYEFTFQYVSINTYISSDI